MKCQKCGFEAKIWEWRMVEKSGTTKLPENMIKHYEDFVDSKKDAPEGMKTLVKGLFRLLGETGMMPYHKTDYVCPKCGHGAVKGI